jgi:hypothetical protein
MQHQDIQEEEESRPCKELKHRAKSINHSIQQSTSRCIELGIPVCLAPYLAPSPLKPSEAQQHVISICNLDTRSLLQMCKTIIDNKKAFKAALKEFQQSYYM